VPGPQGDAGSPGATGAQGLPGAQGPAGSKGADGAVVSKDRLVVASFLDAPTVASGRAVVLRFVCTTSASVVLEVFKGSKRVARLSGRARAGRNSIRWNGKVGGTAAAAGQYRLVLRAASGDQQVIERAGVRITGGGSGGSKTPPKTPPKTGGGGGGGGGGGTTVGGGSD
jgi:hypothetical protein